MSVIEKIVRPQQNEYPPYFDRYIRLVQGSDVVSSLTAQGEATTRLIASIAAHQREHRYAPPKWSVVEVLGHMIDVERMLAYWLWCFTRNDRCARPAVDCEAYVKEARFGTRSLDSINDETRSVRTATLVFAGTLEETLLDRAGIAGGGEITPRAILYAIAGHELHHVGMLRERYGVITE